MAQTLSGFELTMALGLMTPAERIQYQETLDKARTHFESVVEKASNDSADVLLHEQSSVDYPTLQQDMKDTKFAAELYKLALQPPANILSRWRKQQEKLRQIHEQFKREYKTSPLYKAQREFAAEWRKKHNIKGDGW